MTLKPVCRIADDRRVDGRWRLGYRPELDGLRAIAIAAVIGHHLNVPGMRGGFIGVDLFFVLSGFLITAVLLDELACNGRVSLPQFYRRRALRLFPALGAMLLVIGVIAAGVPGMAETRQALPLIVLYVGNWWRAAGGNLGVLGHTWSLAVEEQFYLIWPLVLLALVGRRHDLHRALVVSGVLIVIVLVGRAAAWAGGASVNRLYNGTDSRADALLVGCALALAYHCGLHVRVGRVLTAVAAAFLLTVVAAASFNDGFLYWGGLTAVAVASAILLIAVLEHRPAFLRSRPAVWVGRRSYGLYLWHLPLVRLLPDSWPTAGRAAVVIGTAVAAAALSYRLIERPLLAVRRSPTALDGVRPPDAEPGAVPRVALT